ncbi:iron chelate uptake ABC transporter family permease subunit [Synechococcales cyanobacterium C]|uniref:Iron chelate uptake ABC transporter family permease subunit n=1 Tax=Petrachloros mirabilis ULC683 TaxID=2781853 RepID=A0A8K2A1N2_9CYAN|nr:iron ABC transporter permease [Petrachloros mirabilis]NCJ07822.1 iron chelate uptake ABC transporter family permease subunit [Petrachloros mirabilis ULC683]
MTPIHFPHLTQRWKIQTTRGLILLGLMLGVFLLLGLSLSQGPVAIPLGDIWTTLWGGTPTQPEWRNIILQFRLPKAITAMLAGGALATSGLQLQTLFRNPLAGPFVLGISSGASLGVALVVLANQSLAHWVILAHWGNLGTVLAAWGGASIVTLLVVLAAQVVRSATALLVLGLMLGYVTSALVSILLQMSSAQQMQQYVIWTFGSFGGVTWAQLPWLSAFIGLGMGIAYFLIAMLNPLLLGEAQAMGLGVNTAQVRLGVLLSSSLLSGVVTAFCGPIAFLGVVVPHICRRLLNTADLRWLLPGVTLCGALLALWADWFAQTLVPQTVLPLNAMTALLGAPVVIWAILQIQRHPSPGG